MPHPLLPKLRELKLSGMVNTLDVRATQATERQLTPVEFLALLLDDELERRSQQRLARRLSQSGCDSHKTLAHFDFAAAPGKPGAPAGNRRGAVVGDVRAKLQHCDLAPPLRVVADLGSHHAEIDLRPVDDRRLGQSPEAALGAETLGDVDGPDFLARGGVQTMQEPTIVG